MYVASPFEPSKMQWTSYSERLEKYLVAKMQGKKLQFCLAVSEMLHNYELLGDLCARISPIRKSWFKN